MSSIRESEHGRGPLPVGPHRPAIVEEATRRRLLPGKGGLCGNGIRIKPPTRLTKSDCDLLADCLDACLAAAERTPGHTL